jgi:hypothetical protein
MKYNTIRDTLRTREETRRTTHACRGDERRSGDPTPALSLFLSAHTNTGITDSYRPGDAAAALTQRTPPSFTRTNALIGNLAISTFRAIHSPWEPVSSADLEPFASPQLLSTASDRLAQPATNSTRQPIVLDLT